MHAITKDPMMHDDATLVELNVAVWMASKKWVSTTHTTSIFNDRHPVYTDFFQPIEYLQNVVTFTDKVQKEYTPDGFWTPEAVEYRRVTRGLRSDAFNKCVDTCVMTKMLYMFTDFVLPFRKSMVSTTALHDRVVSRGFCQAVKAMHETRMGSKTHHEHSVIIMSEVQKLELVKMFRVHEKELSVVQISPSTFVKDLGKMVCPRSMHGILVKLTDTLIKHSDKKDVHGIFAKRWHLSTSDPVSRNSGDVPGPGQGNNPLASELNTFDTVQLSADHAGRGGQGNNPLAAQLNTFDTVQLSANHGGRGGRRRKTSCRGGVCEMPPRGQSNGAPTSRGMSQSRGRGSRGVSRAGSRAGSRGASRGASRGRGSDQVFREGSRGASRAGSRGRGSGDVSRAGSRGGSHSRGESQGGKDDRSHGGYGVPFKCEPPPKHHETAYVEKPDEHAHVPVPPENPVGDHSGGLVGVDPVVREESNAVKSRSDFDHLF
ncbi:hypothetical protein T484DRAFT_3647520 [Baffinella frigidus]|nr:hypothetical protein T484DRAFT_3647520 [Cryptophyta sp. CCMP2293]